MAESPLHMPDHPDFTPVPVRSRVDGWTAERQRVFISALRARRCVDAAARTAGLSRESAYRLRRKPGAESFAAAWDAALAAVPRGTTSASLVWHRALYRTARPVIRKGETVGHLIQPDNRALLSLLGRVDRLTRGIEGGESSR
jgi:hypothetical protein